MSDWNFTNSRKTSFVKFDTLNLMKGFRFKIAVATVGTGYIKGDKLTHDSLSNCGNHRINIIQTLVEHIQALVNTLNVQRLFLSYFSGFVCVCQAATSRDIIDTIIFDSLDYVKD